MSSRVFLAQASIKHVQAIYCIFSCSKTVGKKSAPLQNDFNLQHDCFIVIVVACKYIYIVYFIYCLELFNVSDRILNYCNFTNIMFAKLSIPLALNFIGSIEDEIYGLTLVLLRF